MYWTLIKNNIVINVIVADQNFVNMISSHWDAIINVPEDGVRPNIGDSYIDGQFISNG